MEKQGGGLGRAGAGGRCSRCRCGLPAPARARGQNMGGARGWRSCSQDSLLDIDQLDHCRQASRVVVVVGHTGQQQWWDTRVSLVGRASSARQPPRQGRQWKRLAATEQINPGRRVGRCSTHPKRCRCGAGPPRSRRGGTRASPASEQHQGLGVGWGEQGSSALRRAGCAGMLQQGTLQPASQPCHEGAFTLPRCPPTLACSRAACRISSVVSLSEALHQARGEGGGGGVGAGAATREAGGARACLAAGVQGLRLQGPLRAPGPHDGLLCLLTARSPLPGWGPGRASTGTGGRAPRWSTARSGCRSSAPAPPRTEWALQGVAVWAGAAGGGSDG